MKKVRNENWSDLMTEISPSRKAYWGLGKAFKTEEALSTPTLKQSDNSIAFDDREKAGCFADSIKHQCSKKPPYDLKHVRRVEEEGRIELEGSGWSNEFNGSPGAFSRKPEDRCGRDLRRLGPGWQTPPRLYDQSDTGIRQ
ncbi:hypothetical protein EVAR_86398_1 [Eumeta japonica]|uniref:Uncharacterized protein n=1 Tax=Eumeta variegata TaxID=151549 RepID=A0A4C1WAD7_EUMVA|nr:hypothetical protein EVAR_86398_1 [Eumeta japonica]